MDVRTLYIYIYDWVTDGENRENKELMDQIKGEGKTKSWHYQKGNIALSKIVIGTHYIK